MPASYASESMKSLNSLDNRRSFLSDVNEIPARLHHSTLPHSSSIERQGLPLFARAQASLGILTSPTMFR
jgi:hypothetical protein